MKILFVHNKYGAISGEERMIARISELLSQRGHDVSTFFKDSADIKSGIDKASAFLSGIWSLSSAREFDLRLQFDRPDIIQVQNLYPLISPSILKIAQSHKIPVVMRLSNYRLFCPNGLLMSKGQICEKCAGGKEYWCVVRNCESNSLKSIGYAVRTMTARKTDVFRKGVTRFYAQTEFQRDLHIREGIPANRIDVVPNFLTDAEIGTPPVQKSTGNYIGFSGRLSPEKGVDYLIMAAGLRPDIEFRLAGNPEIYKNALLSPNIRFLGHLSGQALKDFYSNARIIVMPSLWYEGFPGVALDAMTAARPVIATRLGGMPDIISDGETGLLFERDDVLDFVSKIDRLWRDPDLCIKMGQAGRNRIKTLYTAASYYSNLMSVYERTLQTHQHS